MACPRGPGEDAQGLHGAAAPADDHPAVGLRHVQAQHELPVGPVELLDPHGVGLGDEPLREIEDEVCWHPRSRDSPYFEMPFALSSFATAALG
jgi:hypothetical protein